jgi:hypothetical protein
VPFKQLNRALSQLFDCWTNLLLCKLNCSLHSQLVIKFGTFYGLMASLVWQTYRFFISQIIEVFLDIVSFEHEEIQAKFEDF